MVGAVRQHAPILSVGSFRAWLASRPDEEHWELIEGVPMMMTPPNRRHQRIASNLENLLNAALKRHNPELAAYQDIGVNIVSTVPYGSRTRRDSDSRGRKSRPALRRALLSGGRGSIRKRQRHNREQT